MKTCSACADDVEHDVPPLVAGRDVQKDQLVGPFVLVPPGDFDRIAGIAQVQEVGSLHDAAPIDIEAGNHTFGKHGYEPERQGR
jgi:hypothetical protein